jgi:hypothetical protein
VPQRIQNAIWALLDSGKLRTLAIVSEEPYIPWELMIPSRPGKPPTSEPLGVRVAIGRWCPRINLAARQRAPMSASLVVAPTYSKIPKPLAHAAAEQRCVFNFAQGRSLTPVNLQSVKADLRKADFDLLHWICHGAQSALGTQSIYVDGQAKHISSTQMNTLRGSWSEREQAPLVFLNACEIGRPSPSLSGIGGFAKVFIDAGAVGVIAPLWSVKDKIAPLVAQQFYDEVSGNPQKPFAEILRGIRAKAYHGATGGEDTYAAYCYYGDPKARRA